MAAGHFRQSGTAAGNALLIVLIGIILFAALMFALTRNRPSGALSAENATLYAQQITSYADKMAGAVQSVMLLNGCLGTQINFANTTVGGYTNASAPANKKCDIFDAKGGGMNFEAPPPEALTTAGNYFFAGNVCVDNMGTGPAATCSGDGLANEDLVMFLPFVSLEVCEAINRTLENTAAMLEDGNGFDNSTKFTGTYVDGFDLGATTYSAACYKSTGGILGNNKYHFYYVLSPR